MKQNKTKETEQVIRSLWDSLESHLPYTYLKSSEGKAFHRTCVRDYAKDIYLLSKHL